MSATQTQVGGSHYKDMKIQPVDYIHANGLGFIEGCVVKYVSRHKSKNGKQDLEKAKHFLELLIEREYPDTKFEAPGYIQLNDGFTFEDGDEFYSDIYDKWKPMPQHYIGSAFDSKVFAPCRRPIAKGSK